MQWHHIGIVLTSIMVTKRGVSSNETIPERSKRTPGEKFNVLLNLYKINPLKHSNVFKTFSDTVILPNKDDTALHIDQMDNNQMEMSDADNLQLKLLENVIHTARVTTSTEKEAITAKGYGPEPEPELFEKDPMNLFDSSSSAEETSDKPKSEEAESPIPPINEVPIITILNEQPVAVPFSEPVAVPSPVSSFFNYKEKTYDSLGNNQVYTLAQENVQNNQLVNTIMLPVNKTEKDFFNVERRLSSSKTIPRTIRFFDNNRFEELNYSNAKDGTKDDDASVLAIR